MVKIEKIIINFSGTDIVMSLEDFLELKRCIDQICVPDKEHPWTWVKYGACPEYKPIDTQRGPTDKLQGFSTNLGKWVEVDANGNLKTKQPKWQEGLNI